MANNSSGQQKIVSNFAEIIDIVETFGTEWKPIDDSLTLVNLKARHAAAETLIESYNQATLFDQLKTDERRNAYISLNGLVKNIFASAKACKMAEATIDRVKTLKDLIDGTNVTQAAARRDQKNEKAKSLLPEGTAAPETSKSRSVSQQTFDDRYDNFKLLITLLTTSGDYKTNEDNLTIEALNAYLTQLATANKATRDADNALKVKREERDKLLSGAENSIYADVTGIKNYLILKEGRLGVNYKKVTAYTFARL